MSEGQQSGDKNSASKEQPQDTKITDAWDKAEKQLIGQHKDKQGAFKSMADDSGFIGENNFNVGGEQKSEIFKRFDADGDGKISQQEWNQGWNNLDVQVLETQHKVQIAQQKLQILDALESKPEPGMNLIPKPTHNLYNSLVQNFKNSSSLDDLTDFLNKKSPFLSPDESANESHHNYKNSSNSRPLDSLLQQFKTPNKIDLFTETGSGQHSAQYQGNSKPTSKFGYVQGSASPGFQPGLGRPDASINSRVHQNMNINIELKDHNKTTKRKEELSQFMGKMGLGSNEPPARATISSEQPNQNVFERMRYYVNNIGASNINKNSSTSGLNELIVDRQFNTSTFKQQLKQYRKDRFDVVEQQPKFATKPLNQLDNPMLQDQSLKSFHLKLLHQQQASNKFARI